LGNPPLSPSSSPLLRDTFSSHRSSGGVGALVRLPVVFPWFSPPFPGSTDPPTGVFYRPHSRFSSRGEDSFQGGVFAEFRPSLSFFANLDQFPPGNKSILFFFLGFLRPSLERVSWRTPRSSLANDLNPLPCIPRKAHVRAVFHDGI